MLTIPVDRSKLKDTDSFNLVMQCGGSGSCGCNNCTCAGNCSYTNRDIIEVYRKV